MEKKDETVEFIQQHIFLIAVVVGSFTAFMFLTFKPRAGKLVNASDATFLLNRENARFIDVRSLDEFQKEHIPNAQNVPLDVLMKEGAARLEAYKNAPLILYCASGIRAEKACAVLKRAGFEKLHNLEGGFDSWLSANHPTQKAKT